MVAIANPGPAPLALRLPADVYRRRRLAVAGLVLVLVVLASALASSLLGAAAADRLAAEPVATVSVVVEPGDTVWSLAESVAPGADPRPVVDAIVDANGGAALTAGQRLTLALP